MAHIAASNGGSSYNRVSGFDIADHMADLYYYFKSRTRRKEILLELLKFLDMKWEGLGKYVTTSWLSLEKCTEKELKNCSALKSVCFSRNPVNSRINDGRQEKGHIDKSYKARVKRLKKGFSVPLTKIHVSFYANALPLSTHYNQFLQRSDLLAHTVKPVTDSLIRKIGMRFLIPDVLDDVTEEDLENRDNYLPLFSAYIWGGGSLGPYCKIYLR